ncbi:hypothetical protein MKW92_025016 [Papaver armeniacum]|nr:hypothetical protein MKW92_025016 [Papaver armeniacum]
MGIIPTVFFHFNHTYEWVTEALMKSGGTFYYRGMFRNFPKGKHYRDRFFDLLGDGILNADGDTWKEQRRAATLEMHSSRFVEYSFQTIQELVHIKLLKLIEKLVISKESIDLQDVLMRFTDPGCLSIDLPDVPFAKAFEQATELTLFRFTVPPFIWKAMKLFCIGSEKELKKAVGVVHKFAEKAVCNRRTECYKLGSLSDRSDLLSRLTELREINRRYTSSVALAWFFWLLSKNPQVEYKILNEINEILSHRKSKNEIMDVVLTRVLYSIYLMARIDRIWGKDCKEYRPDQNQFKYAVFNAGPRLCVGNRFACLQMQMVAASVLLRYSVDVVKGHDVAPKLTTTLYMKKGLIVNFKPRE